jgi:acyl-CoA reductase-like NAD-dependent aldehyde dehydrogenase
LNPVTQEVASIAAAATEADADAAVEAAAAAALSDLIIWKLTGKHERVSSEVENNDYDKS